MRTSNREFEMPREQFVPYYQQIIEDVRRQIAEGRLKPGDKLPSTPKLAAAYGHLSPDGRVSLFTVRTAIGRMIEDGTLHGHQGVGVYVAVPPTHGPGKHKR